MSLVRRQATYEDLLLLAEEPFAEIVDGNLYMSPRPPIPRAVAALALASALGSASHLGPGGWWILFEPELQLAEDILVPDLAAWRRSRLATLPDTVAVDVAPDWICEILSPETEELDRGHKLPAYARHDVSSAWMVDPRGRTLDVFQRTGGRFVLAGAFAGEASVRAEPFAAVEIELRRLWGTAGTPW